MKAGLVRVRGWAAAHPVLFVFLVALAARVVLVLGVYLAHDGALFSDDLLFQRLAREMADGNTAHWSDYDRSLFYGTSTFLWPLTLLSRLVSPVLPGQLMVAVAGAGAAALTTVVGLHALRVWWAIAAGLVMALLPSMVLWSSLTLKDAFVWCVLAALGVVACELDGPPARFAIVGATGVVLLVLMDHLRAQTFVVAVWAFAAALILGGGQRWRARGAVGVIVLLTLPALLGYGVVASSWITDSIHGSVERREGNTVGAASAVACHKTSNDVVGIVRYLPCGLPAAVVRPYPWESGGSLGLNLARVEALAWYPLLALSLFGLTRMWPLRRSLAFPVLASVGSLLVYASIEGNLGTAYRHRGELVWGVALLAALGAQTVASRRARSERFPSELDHAGTLAGEHGA